MCLALIAICRASEKVRNIALSTRFLWGYAALLLICSVVPDLVPGAFILPLTFKSIFVGIPLAFLICAWGRALGAMPIERAVPTVFIATAAAAAVCLLVVSLPVDWAYLILYLLPLGSASFLREVSREADLHSSTPVSASSGDESGERISGKVILGTVCYGLATGLMETLVTTSTVRVSMGFTVTFFLLVAFCLSSLQLFRGVKIARVREFFGDVSAGPLDSVYRLAFMVMLAGFLFVPALNSFGMLGESVVLAGYLSMLTVLMSVFVIVSRLRGHDAVLFFAKGFAALFAGELLGLVAGNACRYIPVASESLIAIAIAGLVVLYSYLFLFTDRDVRELTVVVAEADFFEEACLRIVETFGLSKREAEILPLALRGRTGERIGQELFISKNTVDTHLRRIYGKCNVGSRQELIDLGEKIQEEMR
ncbi:MAG: helix-turn-helix transcriptional regulator [Eggerthellaceae bacterium]|nr:helix-turn-helix transcriptional regulator [Eggerthellaceae bacterium]